MYSRKYSKTFLDLLKALNRVYGRKIQCDMCGGYSIGIGTPTTYRRFSTQTQAIAYLKGIYDTVAPPEDPLVSNNPWYKVSK